MTLPVQVDEMRGVRKSQVANSMNTNRDYKIIVEGCLVHMNIYIPKGGVASVLLVCHPLKSHMEECQYEVEHLYIYDALGCEKPRHL